jgi:ubiquinone/menaquinone biosynthesis C-methylase UbiE
VSKIPENQSQYWDGYIKRDGCFLSQSASRFDAELQEYAQSLCTGLDGASALEIGCGDGSDAVGLVRQFKAARVVAIDIAEKRLEVARQNVRRAGLEDRIELRRMDANRLDFPDREFDVIFCNSVMLFLDRERFIPEAIRVLKPGGRLLLFRESLAGNPLLGAYRALWPAGWKRGAEKFAKRLTVREIEEIGRRFASYEHREFYLLFTLLYRLGPFLRNRVLGGRTEYEVRGGRLSRSLDQMLLRAVPGLRHFAWVTVARFATAGQPARDQVRGRGQVSTGAA